MIRIDHVQSPIGPLTLAVRDGRVCLLHFGADGAAVDQYLGRWYPGVLTRRSRDGSGARAALERYFAGELGALDAVCLEMNGTDFQRRVWDALRAIPPGRTTSYGALARRLGMPAAVRAVGAANGANPVAVIVPCHRVIGANGRLIGYGGGLEKKEWLLRHERAPWASGPGQLFT